MNKKIVFVLMALGCYAPVVATPLNDLDKEALTDSALSGEGTLSD